MSEIRLLLAEIQALKRKIHTLETMSEHLGFAASDIARLGLAQTFTKAKIIDPDTAAANSLILDTAASPSSFILSLRRDGTYKLSWRVINASYVEHRRNTVSMADGDIIDLPYAVYMVEIIDDSGGNYAQMWCQGGVNAVTELVDTGGVFTTTKDTASSFNVYYESSAYHIQNKRGVTRNVAIYLVRGSTTE